VRPVRPPRDGRREIRWPNHEFFAIHSETHAFDLVVGLGVEPHLRWRAFSSHVVELVRSVGARQVILLGAFLDEVIYSQPIQIVGSSTDADLARELGLPPSRYEGPTGIVGVLAEAIADIPVPTLSLWARLPHYVQAAPNSRAALALLQRVESATGFPIDKAALETAAATVDQEVSEAIAAAQQAAGIRARAQTPRVLVLASLAAARPRTSTVWLGRVRTARRDPSRRR
jgi:predicted ATP-grasp superfamily ATP-dependent carboligase